MYAFELKLGNTTYVCSSNHSSKKDQNWIIQAQVHGLKLLIEIPIDSKLTRLQVLAFIERLHEGMEEANKTQKVSVEYLN